MKHRFSPAVLEAAVEVKQTGASAKALAVKGYSRTGAQHHKAQGGHLLAMVHSANQKKAIALTN